MAVQTERDWQQTLLWREIDCQIATWPETARRCDTWIAGSDTSKVFCNRPSVAYVPFHGCYCYSHVSYPLDALPATLLYPMLRGRHYHVRFTSNLIGSTLSPRMETAAEGLDYISDCAELGTGRDLTVVECRQPCH